MSKKITVRSGDRYGDWEIVAEVTSPRRRRFLCQNGQGLRREVDFSHLRSGASTGYFGRGEHSPTRKHGMSKTRLWNIWMSMKRRCLNKNELSYKSYGGRGIGIDPKWMNFEAFYADMATGYSPTMTIERKNVDGDYCKDNCTWVSLADQQKNKTNTLFTEFQGKMVRLRDLAETYGIKYMTLYNRIFVYGFSPEVAVQKGRLPRRFQARPK